MHRSLGIDEIVIAVLSFLQKKDLLSVALTCQTLKEPALNELWRDIPDISHFMRLFPSDAWKDGYRKDIITLERDISAQDWTSVLPKAARVRRLAVDQSINYKPLLNSVALSFNGTHMFPNLQALDFAYDMDRCLPFIKQALSPSLTSLTIHSSGGSKSVRLLSKLDSICPSITSFAFKLVWSHKNTTYSTIGDRVSRLLRSWDQLKSLQIPGSAFSTQTIHYLSRLPQLASLSLNCHPSYPIITSSSFSGFRSLQHLGISDCSPGIVIRILNGLETEQLNSLHVALGHQDELFDGWEGFFQIVAKCTCAAETLKLCMATNFITSITFLDTSALRPLFSARNLSDLYLVEARNLRLNDGFIEELAKASPKLVRLRIGPRYSDSYFLSISQTPLTLNSYRHIFEHCPKIQELEFAINTDIALITKKAVNDQQVRHGGRGFRLGVSCSPVKNPRGVAEFLLPFFDEPIGHLDVPIYALDILRAAWKEVEDQLTGLIERRNQNLNVS